MYIIFKEYDQLSSPLKTKAEIVQWFVERRRCSKSDLEFIKNHTKKGWTVKMWGYEYDVVKVSK